MTGILSKKFEKSPIWICVHSQNLFCSCQARDTTHTHTARMQTVHTTPALQVTGMTGGLTTCQHDAVFKVQVPGNLFRNWLKPSEPLQVNLGFQEKQASHPEQPSLQNECLRSIVEHIWWVV